MGNFTRFDTSIKDLYVIEPTIYNDSRGFFLESYSKNHFEKIGIDVEFVQDNHSKSAKNVLRGIHIQRQYPQGKLVRVIKGSVYDVAVDLRSESETFGSWYGLRLSAENKKMFYIPPRFGHGFLTLEDNTEFLYKTTDYYHPEDEMGIHFNDCDLKIDWKCDLSSIIVSTKDQKLGSFREYKLNIKLD